MMIVASIKFTLAMWAWRIEVWKLRRRIRHIEKIKARIQTNIALLKAHIAANK